MSAPDDYFWCCSICKRPFFFQGASCSDYCDHCRIEFTKSGDWCKDCVQVLDCLSLPNATIIFPKFKWDGVEFSLSTTYAIRDALDREVEKHLFYHKFIRRDSSVG